ncbi:MAG: putative sodium-dependent transporter [Bacteroidetes bacterium]|nr:putative sodium-dependent transporter [Bacteroidota bacterium]
MKRISVAYTDTYPFERMVSFLKLKQKVIVFLKTWTLPASMVSGFLGYVIYKNLHFLDSTHKEVEAIINFVQPALIFLMLFVTFCKVNPHQLQLKRWHLWLVLVQTGSFALLSLLLYYFPTTTFRVVIESAMLCMITPTATAAAVITDKLGGKPASIISYTIVANLVTAIAVPLVFPIVHPIAGQTFADSFSLILAKVFPLLICPFFAAVLVQKFMPKLLKKIIQIKDLAFYMWAVALALAIGVTTRTLFHTDTPVEMLGGIAVVSLASCLLQFYLGRMISKPYGEMITGGQALGQKTTVLAIWMGYTFLSPITALAGGFYSIWHNVVNSWQLYQQKKKEEDLKQVI